MNKHLIRKLCITATAAVAAASMMATGPASATPGDIAATPPPATVTTVQPGTGSSVYVKRVAATRAGEAQRWRLNVGAWVRNDGTDTLSVNRIQVAYAGGSNPNGRTFLLTKLVKIEPGKSSRVVIPDDRELPFPVPSKVTLRFSFVGYSTVTEFIRPVREYANATALKSYYFPARASDLQPDQYWANGTHDDNQGQNEAFDYNVRQYHAGTDTWKSIKPGTQGWANTDHYIYGKPVYAMADGLVLWCNRTVDENVPTFNKNPAGTKGSGGGNDLFVEHADGEVALYAHFKDNSVPASLCPTEHTDISGLGLRVKAGQLLGQVGNTGRSTNPHLHLHVVNRRPESVAGGSDDSHGRPIRFHNMWTRAVDPGWKGLDPNALATSWAVASPGAWPGNDVLIRPNPCGWDAPRPGGAEYARHGVNNGCHQDVVNEAVFAGYRPVWVDGFDVGGQTFFNSVHRPAGTPQWAARHGLTSAQYQDSFDTFGDAGFRATHVESYLKNGQVRYAVVFVKDGAPRPVAYHGADGAAHQAKVDDLVGRGYRPVNVSVVSVDGARRYTALFEKIDVGGIQLTSAIPAGDYQKWVDDNKAAGRRLVYINAYAHAGSLWFSAIATSAASSDYRARHGLSGAQYNWEWDAAHADGLLTRVVTGYGVGNQARYAAVWRA